MSNGVNGSLPPLLTTRFSLPCPDGIKGAWDEAAGQEKDESFSITCAEEVEEELSPTVDPEEEFVTEDVSEVSTTEVTTSARAMESRKEKDKEEEDSNDDWCKDAEVCLEFTNSDVQGPENQAVRSSDTTTAVGILWTLSLVLALR